MNNTMYIWATKVTTEEGSSVAAIDSREVELHTKEETEAKVKELINLKIDELMRKNEEIKSAIDLSKCIDNNGFMKLSVNQTYVFPVDQESNKSHRIFSMIFKKKIRNNGIIIYSEKVSTESLESLYRECIKELFELRARIAIIDEEGFDALSYYGLPLRIEMIPVPVPVKFAVIKAERKVKVNTNPEIDNRRWFIKDQNHRMIIPNKGLSKEEALDTLIVIIKLREDYFSNIARKLSGIVDNYNRIENNRFVWLDINNHTDRLTYEVFKLIYQKEYSPISQLYTKKTEIRFLNKKPLSEIKRIAEEYHNKAKACNDLLQKLNKPADSDMSEIIKAFSDEGIEITIK